MFEIIIKIWVFYIHPIDDEFEPIQTKVSVFNSCKFFFSLLFIDFFYFYHNPKRVIIFITMT